MEKSYVKQINDIKNKISKFTLAKTNLEKTLREIKSVLKHKNVLDTTTISTLSNNQTELQNKILKIESILTEMNQDLKILIRKNIPFAIRQMSKKIDEFISEKGLKSFFTEDGLCHFELIPATDEEAIKDNTYQKLLYNIDMYEYNCERPVSFCYLKYKMRTIESFEDIYLEIFSFETKDAHFHVGNCGIGAIRMKNFCKYIDEFCKNLHLRTDGSIKKDYEFEKQKCLLVLSQKPFFDNYNYYQEVAKFKN